MRALPRWRLSWMPARVRAVVGRRKPGRSADPERRLSRSGDMYRYRLIDHRSGDDLGPLVSLRRMFAVAERITRTPDEQFEVVNVVEAGPHENFSAYLVVRRV
jgi:hypothetical protein